MPPTTKLAPDATPELPARLAVGATGRARTTGATYRLIAPVARGGMGELYLAERTVVDLRRADGVTIEQVIVKRLLENLRDDRAYVEMFRSEAEHLALLSHPNVVRILDVPEINGARCLALEYVRGRSMAQIIDRARALGQRVPGPLAVWMIAEVLEGLDHVHAARLDDGQSLELVHRDVTPGNLLVSFDGDVKLTDFGIAKSHLSKVATTVGIVKGKARYLAPEQILGERATPRSDLFSVGCVIYELLTGIPLFDRPSVPKTLTAIVHGELPDLYGQLGTTRRVTELVLRTLAVQPDRRHDRARALAADLRAALAEDGPLPTRRDAAAYVRGLFAGQDESWEQAPLSAAEAADLEPEVGFDVPDPSRPTMSEAAAMPPDDAPITLDDRSRAPLRAASIAEQDAVSLSPRALDGGAGAAGAPDRGRAEQTMLVDRVRQRVGQEAADTVALPTSSPLGARDVPRAADGAKLSTPDSATVAEIHLRRPKRLESDFDDRTEALQESPARQLDDLRGRAARDQPTRVVRPLDRTVVGPEPTPPERRARPRRGRGVLGALARLPVPMLAGVFLLGSLTGVGLTAVLRMLRDEPSSPPAVDAAHDAIPPSATPSNVPAPTEAAATAAAATEAAARGAEQTPPVDAPPPSDGAAAPTTTAIDAAPSANTPNTPNTDTPIPGAEGAAARLARLDVVHPKNARVMIDGEARGKVPLVGLELPPGRHELTLILKRSRREVVLELEPGRRTIIDKDELRRLEAE